MQHSASDVEITSETLFPRKQEHTGWGYGHTSLVFCGLGILVLTVVLAGAHSKVVTVGWIGLLALSVILGLGGLVGACFSFSDRKLDKARAVFATELAALDTHTHESAESVESARQTANETRLELATLAGAVRLISKRLDEVTALLAQMSLGQDSAAAQQGHAPRQRRRRARKDPTMGDPTTGGKVINQPTAKIYQLGIAEGLRRKRDGDDKQTDK